MPYRPHDRNAPWPQWRKISSSPNRWAVIDYEHPFRRSEGVLATAAQVSVLGSQKDPSMMDFPIPWALFGGASPRVTSGAAHGVKRHPALGVGPRPVVDPAAGLAPPPDSVKTPPAIPRCGLCTFPKSVRPRIFAFLLSYCGGSSAGIRFSVLFFLCNAISPCPSYFPPTNRRPAKKIIFSERPGCENPLLAPGGNAFPSRGRSNAGPLLAAVPLVPPSLENEPLPLFHGQGDRSPSNFSDRCRLC